MAMRCTSVQTPPNSVPALSHEAVSTVVYSPLQLSVL